MSRWSEQFENHPIHDTVQTLRDWLCVDTDKIDSDNEDERRRLSKALDLMQSALKGLDAELFPVAQVNNLNKQLRQPQIWNELSNFASNQNVQHLRQANDHLTGVLPLVYQIASLAGPPDTAKAVRSVEEAYGKFCKVIENAQQDFVARLSESEKSLVVIQDELATHKKALENLKAQSDEAFSEWQNEFGEAQNSRAEEFSAAQIQRGEKYDITIREIRTKSEADTSDISAKHNERLQSAFDEYSREVQRRLDDMKAKHDSILEIHGLVGTDGVAGGYQKTALDEHKAANTWRLVAMVSLGLTAAWLLLKISLGFGETSSGGVNWAEMLTAGSLTLVLLAAAGYASKQSKTHRDLEQQMRWFSLEVKAIDPFLSSLEDADQKELKKQLSERLFGKDRAVDHTNKGGVDAGAFKEIAESILSPVQEIMKLSGRG